MTAFQSIAIDGAEYRIALPHKHTDYIQQRIEQEQLPYELGMLRDMAGRLSSGDRVLDVGANVGNHTLYLAAAVGCRVEAFEPNAELCEAIRESLAANGLENHVRLHCVGVGSGPGKAFFSHLDEANLGAQSLSVGAGDEASIDIIRLDDLVLEGAVKAIKVDVEGMELDVLEGANELIHRDKPLLYVECQKKSDFQSIAQWMGAQGYIYRRSYNATPTHLFIHNSQISGSDLPEQTLIELRELLYDKDGSIREARERLDLANLRYREANQRIAALKEEFANMVESEHEVREEASRLQHQLTMAQQSPTYVLRKYLFRFKRRLGSAGGFRQLPKRLARRLLRSCRHMWASFRHRPLRTSGTTVARSIVPPRDLDALNIESLKNKPAKELRVASIMDDFTWSSYAPECRLTQLTPSNWQAELEECQPDLLFIESAWCGNDQLWGSKVGHTSEELQGILRWCRERHVPTLFWNKEDPIHFETFLNTARLFDHVFTTDIDCINRYKAALGHECVHLLPFAAQPRANNPIEKYERKDAFCFAGAYYARYSERTRDLANFVEHLSACRPLEIYDRNYGKENPDYQFPDIYRTYIVGTLPFEEIDKAYKGYCYAINLNSIKQSQTMFARRVFELLASNTVTVSNYSRGVRLLFGDLVVTSDEGGEIVRRLEALAGDELHLRKFRLAGLRKVMCEHTYADRLAYILARISGQPMRNRLPPVLVMGRAKTQIELDTLLEHFNRQTYSNCRLLVVVGPELGTAIADHRERVRMIPADEAGESLLAEHMDDASWVAGMVAADYYGPNYLMDLALATRYSESDLIGKVAHYRWDNESGLETELPEAEYRPAESVPTRASLVRAERLAHVALYDFADGLHTEIIESGNALAIDAFNYCRQGMLPGAQREVIESIVNDLPGLDEGISLENLLDRAEAIAPQAATEDDGPILAGPELAAYFKSPQGKLYDFTVDDSHWLIRSNLPHDKHDYLYAAQDIKPEEWGWSDQAILHFDVTPGLNVQLVLMFLDEHGKRIGATVCPANRNHDVPVPEGTVRIRPGLRLYGTGAATINGLVLGHRTRHPAEVIGRSRTLVLTNHYPSYDDLYRNGFVHSRVKAYKERGVNVDVFRLRTEETLSYHEFQDVDVITGSQEALHKLVAGGSYQHVLVHFLDPSMWEVLSQHIDHLKVIVWVHGAEIHPWYRRKFNIETAEHERVARAESDKRMAFWRGLLDPMPPNLKLVFVSRYFAEEVMEDLGFRLPEEQYAVIHNPIDTELFDYQEKYVEQRKKILSIRPFASRIYANDLSVGAVQALRYKPFFKDLEFHFVGDGKLFDETMAPLRNLPNVIIEKRFLPREEIAVLHKEYGIFLCPSRCDSQGVSRDEAMSSGLVPITNAVAATPEFVNAECGVLAPAEDAESLAHAIETLFKTPKQFQALSKNAARRVREQSMKDRIVNQEIRQFTGQPTSNSLIETHAYDQYDIYGSAG